MLIKSPIKSDKLLLRNLERRDVSTEYLSWLGDPEVNRYLEVRFSQPQIMESVIQFVESANESDNTLFLGIFLQKPEIHIGNIKLGPIDPNHSTAEIGLLIGDKKEWGKGYASIAISLVAKYAFESLSIKKLTAGCYAANEGSRRSFLKAGFEEEGRRKSQWLVDGVRQDGILLGLVNPG